MNFNELYCILNDIQIKSRLDEFWQHQDMIYDSQAELHGTGSRSLHNNYKLEYIV